MPYCTSDGYAGRRDASDETGGYAFHGKIVLEAVITDLLDQVLLGKTSKTPLKTIHPQPKISMSISLQKVVYVDQS